MPTVWHICACSSVLISRETSGDQFVRLRAHSNLLSELTCQTIPVVMRISLSILSSQIIQILNSMHKVNGFPAKTLGKSGFNLLTDWSGQPVLTNRKCNTQKVPSFFCEILTVFPGYWLLDGIFFIITCQCQLIL